MKTSLLVLLGVSIMIKFALLSILGFLVAMAIAPGLGVCVHQGDPLEELKLVETCKSLNPHGTPSFLE